MITIQPMTAADCDAVISIHRRSIYGLCKDHYTEAEMKAWTGRLTPELFDEGMKDDNNVGVVATEGAFVIGYGFFNLNDQELRALYVLPEYKGQGAGRLILARLEDTARERHIVVLSLQSTINAVDFYEKFGYQNIKQEKHRIAGDISVACVRMKKMLDVK